MLHSPTAVPPLRLLAVAALAAVAFVAACGDGVGPEKTTEIVITPSTPIVLVSIGETKQLSAETRDASGSETDGPVTWESTDAAVATVDDAGLVTAVGNGTAEIRASSDGVSASVQVTVAQAPATIAITPAQPDTLRAIGDTLRFSAEVRDANDHAIADAAVTWSSSDSAVVRVDASGLATAVASGAAEVEAAVDTVSTRVTVVVESGYRVAKVGGDAQTDTVRATLAAPLVVRVRRIGADAGVAGVAVAFRASHGGSAGVDTTDADGLARTLWTLGDTAGVQTVEVTVDGGATALATFTATAQAGRVAGLALESGDGQVAMAGQTLPAEIVVRATDAYGNASAGAEVDFAVTRGGGSLTSADTAADTLGLARATWQLGSGSMDQAIRVTADGAADTVVVNAGVDPTRVVTVELPDSAAVGDTISLYIALDVSALGGERRGVVAGTVRWPDAVLAPIAAWVKDNLELGDVVVPDANSVAFVVSRSRNNAVDEVALIIDCVVQSGAGTEVPVTLELAAMVGAGTFTELDDAVSVVGGTLRIR